MNTFGRRFCLALLAAAACATAFGPLAVMLCAADGDCDMERMAADHCATERILADDCCDLRDAGVAVVADRLARADTALPADRPGHGELAAADRQPVNPEVQATGHGPPLWALHSSLLI